jgi:hypothetical protein
MAFHTADYDVYVFIGDPAAQPIWRWDKWQLLMPALDDLLQVARGPASTRSTQFLPNRGGTVKFGRIGWKESDQQKWTHRSPRIESRRSLCHSKVRRNRTGAPGSPKRTWAENVGAEPHIRIFWISQVESWMPLLFKSRFAEIQQIRSWGHAPVVFGPGTFWRGVPVLFLLGSAMTQSRRDGLRVTLVQISLRGAAVLSLSATTLHGNPDLTLVIPRGCDFF